MVKMLMIAYHFKKVQNVIAKKAHFVFLESKTLIIKINLILTKQMDLYILFKLKTITSSKSQTNNNVN